MTCKAALASLYKIGRIRKFLDRHTAERPVNALVISRLEYCTVSRLEYCTVCLIGVILLLHMTNRADVAVMVVPLEKVSYPIIRRGIKVHGSLQ
jgi:hypothetical protein